MKVCVIGMGYIGLPTAAIFAKNDVDVLGVDISQNIVDTINKGEIHIEETGLSPLIKECVSKGKLRASTKPEESDAFIIAVPTPNNKDEYLSCNLSYVESAVKSILPFLKSGDTIIIESTIFPRATEDYIKPIIESAGFTVGEDVFLAHCPERVLPGKILEELVENNRIVGGITPKCSDKAAKFYEVFVKGEIVKTEAKTAELSKLIENTFRDVNIALANELAKICKKLQINVLDVINMANKHPRVNIHNPGPGVGGHCLAIDPYFIYSVDPENTKLIKLARDINNSMPLHVVGIVEELLAEKENANISVFGVTYKPNVDDLRESPALKIIDILKDKKINIKIHDPHAKIKNNLSKNDALIDSDLVLILVGHDEFKENGYFKVKEGTKIFDVTGMIKDDSIINYGNVYKYTK